MSLKEIKKKKESKLKSQKSKVKNPVVPKGLSPMIPWVGGKRRELDIINKHFPKNYDIYGEPFVGGGAMYFNLNPDKAYINDFHTDLYNFYKVIKSGQGKEIYRKIKNLEGRKNMTTEERFYYLRDQYKPKNEVDKAFRFFYLIKKSFGGRMNYNKAGRLSPTFGFRDGPLNKIEFLKEDNHQNLLKKTKITNLDFETAMLQNDSKATFHFCDPPYYNVFSKYGKKDFTDKDHKRLAETFYKLKGKCLIIIKDDPYIRKLYKRRNIKGTYPITYPMAGKSKVKVKANHLIIKNY